MPANEPRQSPTVLDNDNRLARLRRLVWWLDEGIRVPGTRIRIGLDPILGLVPGLGDAAGALLGATILVEALRRRVPRATLVRVVGNIIVDTVAGAVPVIGDVFDWVWKSNRRNLQLLERHSTEPIKARREDRLIVVGMMSLLVAICLGLLFAVGMLAASVVRAFTGL
jgi:hypothetical protein